jgi:hypothetical protein
MPLTYDDTAAMLHGLFDLPSQSGHNDGTKVIDILSALAAPDQLAVLLKAIRSNPKLTAKCAEESFKHPLGFTKITLLDAPPSFTLRLHIWRPMQAVINLGHVHNHRFGLITAIVSGGYDMHLFQPDAAGISMTEYREHVSPSSGWRLDRVGAAQLTVVSMLRLQAGASYMLPPETLHRVAVNPSAACITLFLQAATTRSFTRVYVPQGSKPPTRTPKIPFDTATYRRQLELILGELAGHKFSRP